MQQKLALMDTTPALAALDLLNEMLTTLSSEKDLVSALALANNIHGAARMAYRIGLIHFDQWNAMNARAMDILNSIK